MAIMASAGQFTFKEIPFPRAKHNQALIKVTAISLNRGEVRTAMNKEEEWIPGWDLAGEVIQAAEDGTGPALKSRVVGFVSNGAWAQYVAVPTQALAALPDNVTDAEAATLPVAGLTALYALGKGGQLIGERVLITGATGGVGMFAVQIAAVSGAHVTALVRSKTDAEFIKALGADEVTDSLENIQPFELVLDSIGGDEIGKLIKLVKPFGTLVSFGNSSEQPTASYEVAAMYRSSASLYGFILFNELKKFPACDGLERLADLINRNKLKPLIEVEADWKDIAQVANDLMERKFKGKAVLYIRHDGEEE